MSRARIAAVVVLGLRIAYGLGLVAAPARLTKSWLGPAGAQPATQVPVRGVGAREIALHGAALVAAATGAPVRPWLAASVAGDLADIASTAAAGRALPARAVPKTAAAAGVSAALTAGVAAVVDS
jgi:hypothetical protein